MEVPAKMSACQMVFMFMKPMFLKQENMHLLMLHFTDKPSDHAIVKVCDVELNNHQLLKRGSRKMQSTTLWLLMPSN